LKAIHVPTISHPKAVAAVIMDAAAKAQVASDSGVLLSHIRHPGWGGGHADAPLTTSSTKAGTLLRGNSATLFRRDSRAGFRPLRKKLEMAA